jgi:CheY-like chemotaxis protein
MSQRKPVAGRVTPCAPRPVTRKHKIVMTKLILHVEDDENDVLLTRHAMEKAGVVNPVQVACDGQQAIDYLKGEGKFANRAEFPLPYLVLLDLKLPYVPGIDVLKFIRQAHLPALVVVLTSSDSQADIAEAYHFGANGYIVKPNESARLFEIAKAIKDFWLTLNRPPSETPRVSGQVRQRSQQGAALNP